MKTTESSRSTTTHSLHARGPHAEEGHHRTNGEQREQFRLYMAAYRKTPPARLRSEVAKVERVRQRLTDLVEPLRDDAEPHAAEILQLAAASLGAALIELNAAVAALPSVGDYERRHRGNGKKR